MMPIQLIKSYHQDNEPLNKELEAYVMKDMEKKRTAVQRSNIGGWQSERELHAHLDDGTPGSALLIRMFANFCEPINDYIKECAIQCNILPNEKGYDWAYTGAWFNVASRGAYNAPHTHPLSQISGAYYIRTEEPIPEFPFSGRIDFFYPGGDTNFFPTPGTLLLFPSTMLHFVHPYYGTGHRISLSFNINNIQPLV